MLYNKYSQEGKPNDKSKPGRRLNTVEENNMTQSELILYLETLAELIEAKAGSVTEAANIIRDKAEKLK